VRLDRESSRSYAHLVKSARVYSMTWSAPGEPMNSNFSGVSTPVTSAPCSLASCTADMPEPSPAPLINTFCPGWTCPLSKIPCSAMAPAWGRSCGFLVAHAGRHWRQGALWNAHVLGEPAHVTEDVGEHVVAWLEFRRSATCRLNPSGDVRPEDVVAWTQRAHDPGVQWFAPQRLPVGAVEGYRLDLDQHLVVLGRGLSTSVNRSTSGDPIVCRQRPSWLSSDGCVLHVAGACCAAAGGRVASAATQQLQGCLTRFLLVGRCPSTTAVINKLPIRHHVSPARPGTVDRQVCALQRLVATWSHQYLGRSLRA
jgi:hypothetical protein